MVCSRPIAETSVPCQIGFVSGGVEMRRFDWLIVTGLTLALVGYWLTTLGTQSYRWAPDWVWDWVQQRPTLVVIGAVLVLVGAFPRLRLSRQR